MKINFAKLNHALIPTTKEGRDRFRVSLFGRAMRPFAAVYMALSEEGRILAAISMLLGGLGLEVQGTDAHLAWCALTAVLAGSVVVQRRFRLDGVRVEVLAAPRVAVGEEITFTVMLRNEGEHDAVAVRLVGPFLPWDGRWLAPAPRAMRVPAGQSVRLEVKARFVERGQHHLDPFEAAALVPLGLAQGPAIASGGVRFLVVPRIARVTRLGLPLGRRHQPGGVALASKTGESMELLGVGPYRAGDPVRHLHARSWGRRGAPVVREYQEEYFSRVGVLVETAGAGPERVEAILSLAAGVVAHLSRGEALIDLLVVGGEVHDLTLGRHLGFLEQALDLLACVEVDAEPTGADALLARLSPHLGRLSCMVIVSGSRDGGALGARIRGAGVGCRTLVGVEGGGSGAGEREASPKVEEEVVEIDARAVAGEALVL